MTPTEDGAWRCERHDKRLLAYDQRTGCFSHLFIPDLIRGEQIDADPGGTWVVYRKSDGSIWRDGAA